MAFASFGGQGGAAAAPSVQSGPDLGDIQTEGLGFLALAGDSKVKLLPTPWPVDNLPPPTASLMSVASNKGLVAAAGPDAVILATTESVRNAFKGPNTGDRNIKPFEPQLTLPMPMRLSQVAFAADESYLVLAAEVGGGLAVYDVQALLQGSTQSAFELSTNGQAVRALVPNPTAEKGELFAVVTADGNLMMANLKERSFVTGSTGQVLKEGVSCLSWSTKGKQLVAGLGNGTAYQMTPEGVGKADIPKPPAVDNNHHVSSITWIENNIFLLVHTPSNFDSSQAPSSIFHIATRTPPSSFVFQKISEPAGPFGLNRSPPHHFFLRLRDFPPNLQDAILVASTASADIGLYSRSKTPLAHDKPAGVFAMTEMSDDSRRAQLPMTADLDDTSPIGVALDLSSKENVVRPIPSDERDTSQTPLPGFMVLNNEGVVASWWIVYSESVRQGTVYPGLAVAEGTQQPAALAAAPAQAPTSTSAFGAPAKPAFGAPSTGAFGAATALGQRQSPWGAPSTTAAFGAPAFGTPAAPKPAFGAPAFGATSTPAFGSSGFAPKASPWGSAASTTTTSAFGQPSGPVKPAGTFGSAAPAAGAAAPSTSGFASFASTGGFAAAAAAAPSTGSVFGGKPSTSAFGGPSTGTAFGSGSPFGGAPKQPDTKPGGVFGAAPSSNGFVLGSTFTADPAAKDEAQEAANEPKGPSFGGPFGNALGDAAKAPLSESKDADMDTAEDAAKPEEPAKPASTSASAPSIFSSASSAPSSGGLFRRVSQTTPETTSKPSPAFSFAKPDTETPKPVFNFLNKAAKDTKPEEAKAKEAAPKAPSFLDVAAKAAKSQEPKSKEGGPKPFSFLDAAPKGTEEAAKVKEEPLSDGETGFPPRKTDDAPLPPDATSKPFYAAGDTSVSSTGTDAPLPPDFMPKKKDSPPSTASEATVKKPIPASFIPPADVPLGPDDDGSESEFLSEENDGDESEGPSDEGASEDEHAEEDEDEEGSGEDVAKDLSPVSEVNETLGFTPQSSFGGLNNVTPDSTLFTKIQKPGQPNQGRSLFGELDRAAPVLPPPNQKVMSSPRSPSPVRSAIPGRMLRTEASRSVSAPGMASQLLGSQRQAQQPVVQPSTFTLTVEQQKAQEKRRAEARAIKEAEEKQALVDNEDEDLQRFLASEPVATTTLDEFVAHSNYISASSMDSIPGQVETVYRDINSMIDTLGLNARTLKCFIKGHTEQRKETHRTRSDLEDGDNWCLAEIEDLSYNVENTLFREFEESRLQNVEQKTAACNELQKELGKLRAKHEDIKKIHAAHCDPNLLASARAQPLSAEQAAQQHDLRREFTKVQNLIAEAEEGLAVLKANLVSQAASNGRSTSGAVLTVDAVIRTITKMTSMAEKRSGDIDVLEGQMRKLGFNPTASTGSREGSPFATPQNKRTSMRNTGTSSTYGLFYTPDSIKETSRGFQDSLMSSTGSFSRGSPPRKKLSGYSAEEKNQLRTRLAKKKMVTDRLREGLQKAGTNVRLMDDEDDKFWG